MKESGVTSVTWCKFRVNSTFSGRDGGKSLNYCKDLDFVIWCLLLGDWIHHLCVFPTSLCDSSHCFGWIPWCALWLVGHYTIGARCGFSISVSPGKKWPNLILSLFQVICQGAQLVLGLPLLLMGNLDLGHGRIKWCSGEGQRRKAPYELHVVQAVPASPNLPRLSSTLFYSSSHVKQHTEALLGCSWSPSLSPAALNWTLGSATLLKLCTSVTSSYLSANELHQWLAGYRLKQSVLADESRGFVYRCYNLASAPCSADKKLLFIPFSFSLREGWNSFLTSWLCSWCFKGKIYTKMMRVTTFFTVLFSDPPWLIKMYISLLLRDFCFLFLQVTLTEEVRILCFIALQSSPQ